VNTTVCLEDAPAVVVVVVRVPLPSGAFVTVIDGDGDMLARVPPLVDFS